MPFSIIAADITRVRADALVVAASSDLVADGGVGLAVARAAGLRRMRRACRAAAPCAVGDAVVTGGFDLAADHVVHAVAPVWRGGDQGEEALLRHAYESALGKAAAVGAQSVALSLLGAGAYGVPVQVSLDAARGAVGEFLDRYADADVTLVVYGKEAIRAAAVEWKGVSAHLAQLQEREEEREREESRRRAAFSQRRFRQPLCSEDFALEAEADAFQKIPDLDAVRVGAGSWMADALPTRDMDEEAALSAPCSAASLPGNLEDLLSNLDEGFSGTLLSLIDARGLTDAQVYKRANMSRQLFSKIRSNASYVPTKRTVLALAVALELDLDQTRDLLARAGYALSRSNRFDVIMEYLISRGVYDVFTINETLFQFDQPLLGGRG
ncbi:MAG: macro domain-containing protein [Eggerthellales bacterium]|nr:macro domain-containing protein [Eggerthellales bacterium]